MSLLANPIKALWIGGDYDCTGNVHVEIVGYDYLNYPVIELIGGSLRIPVTLSELLVF